MNFDEADTQWEILDKFLGEVNEWRKSHLYYISFLSAPLEDRLRMFKEMLIFTRSIGSLRMTDETIRKDLDEMFNNNESNITHDSYKLLHLMHKELENVEGN